MHSSGAGPTAVEAVDLHKAFAQIHAVDGVDLDLRPGRIYGLLGPNGSGKTTLIRLLSGLAKATSGEARILGTRMPSRPMLGQIGYMPQAEALYPDLSVGENLGFFEPPGAWTRPRSIGPRARRLRPEAAAARAVRGIGACPRLHPRPRAVILFLDDRRSA
jgi:ABC-type Fe3+/spermidine/putrescine transport system ATPase subunit